MIFYDVIQGSEEWHNLRCGMPTASMFKNVLTMTANKDGLYKRSASDYAHRLIADRILGRVKTKTKLDSPWGVGVIDLTTSQDDEDDDEYESEDMLDGKLYEAKAAEWYAEKTGCTLRNGGFCTDDRGRYGCSVDRFINENGGIIEIKTPAAHTHIKALLNGFDKQYFQQVQGQLLITCADWADWVSYSKYPDLPHLIIRTERDEEYISQLEDALNDMCDYIEDGVKTIKSLPCF